MRERERDAKWKARVLKNLRKAMTSVEVFDEFQTHCGLKRFSLRSIRVMTVDSKLIADE